MVDSPAKIRVEGLGVSYGDKIALKNLSLQVPANEIFGIIGPAQSGKTTFLKAVNRTIDFISNATVKGKILIAMGQVDVYAMQGKMNVGYAMGLD